MRFADHLRLRDDVKRTGAAGQHQFFSGDLAQVFGLVFGVKTTVCCARPAKLRPAPSSQYGGTRPGQRRCRRVSIRGRKADRASGGLVGRGNMGSKLPFPLTIPHKQLHQPFG